MNFVRASAGSSLQYLIFLKSKRVDIFGTEKCKSTFDLFKFASVAMIIK